MANKYLLPVYEKILGEAFNYSNFDNRLKMQKVIYLLQEMGVPISNYGFSWYKYGPYSQALLDDAYSVTHHENLVDSVDLEQLSSDNQDSLATLKEMLSVPDGSQYPIATWCECVASIQFLRQNVFPQDASGDTILAELCRRKPHLTENSTNCEALKRVQLVFA